MTNGFRAMKRRGVHYDLARRAVECLRTTAFPAKTQKERVLEHTMVSSLMSVPAIRPHLITQLDDDPVDKVTHSEVLGFRHRPDATIGRDGTALELKMVRTGQPLREAIGQAIAYRVAYRFVVLVLIDRTPHRRMLELAADESMPGYELLTALAREMGIFTIVAPRADGRSRERHAYDNIVFAS